VEINIMFFPESGRMASIKKTHKDSDRFANIAKALPKTVRAIAPAKVLIDRYLCNTIMHTFFLQEKQSTSFPTIDMLGDKFKSVDVANEVMDDDSEGDMDFFDKFFKIKPK